MYVKVPIIDYRVIYGSNSLYYMYVKGMLGGSVYPPPLPHLVDKYGICLVSCDMFGGSIYPPPHLMDMYGICLVACDMLGGKREMSSSL